MNQDLERPETLAELNSFLAAEGFSGRVVDSKRLRGLALTGCPFSGAANRNAVEVPTWDGTPASAPFSEWLGSLLKQAAR